MLLSGRPLTDVQSVNSFRDATEISINKGDAVSLYIQLVDLEQNLAKHAFSPPGLRYIPVAGATLQVQFQNIDDAKVFTRMASNPFPDDRSIWRFSILATDPIDSTQNVKCTLTEGVVVRSFFLPALIRSCAADLRD